MGRSVTGYDTIIFGAMARLTCAVFAAWAIAPGIAGVFASAIFLITKYGVMRRSNPLRNALVAVPFYFFLSAAMLACKSSPPLHNSRRVPLI